jgi:uncharacterized protein with PIN domain
MMNQVHLRFYAELNDFLPPEKKQVRFKHEYRGKLSVKHLIESFNVPHIEVDLILANGDTVDFSYIVGDGDYLSVYPLFESIDISAIGRLRPLPLRNPRFILDIHLGQLATYMRLIGFDSLYSNDYEDPVLARISSEEERILLTKDRGLLKRSLVTHGYCVREIDPEKQLIEIIRRFDLGDSIKPFRRCLRCNHLLQPVPKAKIIQRLQHDTVSYFEEFHICKGCDQIYWKGSHYQHMIRFLDRVLGIEI